MGAPSLATELLHLPHKAAGVGGRCAYPVFSYTSHLSAGQGGQAGSGRAALHCSPEVALQMFEAREYSELLHLPHKAAGVGVGCAYPVFS